MWKQMPDFRIALEAHRKGWSSPTRRAGKGNNQSLTCISDPTVPQEECLTRQSAQRWMNFNEYEALLFQAEAARGYSDAMIVLQLALEEDLPTADNEAIADCRVLAASSWILHCAKIFFEWAQENVDAEVSPSGTSAYLEAGTLYQGKPMICHERWTFWRHRFEELGKPNSILGSQARETSLRAAQVMRMVETSVINP